MANDVLTRADHAQKLKQNPVWRDAWGELEKILNDRLLSCNTTTEKDVIADIARCKQLAKMMQSRIEKYIESGKAEELRLKEIEKKSISQNLIRAFKR